MTDFLRFDIGAIAGLMIWCGLWFVLGIALKPDPKADYNCDDHERHNGIIALFRLGAVFLVLAIATLPLALIL